MQDINIRSKASEKLYDDVFDEFQDYRRGGKSSVAELKSATPTNVVNGKNSLKTR